MVCPRCETQTLFDVELSTRASLTCPKCRATFQSLITTIRAKRSNGSKRENRRRFSVRVQNFDGSEQLIEFVNAGISDFELRSRDMAAFSYMHGELRAVQNMTVHRYMRVSKPYCFIATYVYGGGSPEVQLLRAWRDIVLLRSPVGVRLVRWYYKISEPLLKVCGNSSVARRVARMLLTPVVWSIERSHLPKKA